MDLKLLTFIGASFLLLIALTTRADIRNSHHDFSNAAWSGYKVCLPCHIPHNADVNVPDSPLWNHQTTSSTFTVYSSSTLDAVPGQPSGRSKLCLSCHDGTVAIENHSGNTNGTMFTTWGNLTTDLQNDHPISFTYDATLAAQDGALYDPTTTPSGLGGTIDEDLLVNGKMECTTCHDVHIARNTQGCTGCHFVHQGTTKSLSLRKSNDGSAFCLTCHIK